jgi:hypothetical protein
MTRLSKLLAIVVVCVLLDGVFADGTRGPKELGGSPRARLSDDAQPGRRCLMVEDPSGDAGPLVTARGETIPRNQRALDLLGAGAEVAPGALAVSALVAEPMAAVPAGYDSIYWTLSWRRAGGGRWFAQARRGAGGVRFSFGSDESSPDYPTSGITRAMAVAGSLDPAGVVTIMVPWEAVGESGGERLAGFGAAAWATDTTGVYTLVDATGTASSRTAGCRV